MLERPDPPPALPSLADLEAARREACDRADPTAALLAEHRWLEDALLALPAEAGDSGPPPAEAFATMTAVLDVHIEKEEQAYFPPLARALTEAGRDATVIDDMLGEHDGIRLRREAVATALAAADSVERAIRAFTHALAVHFENEEELVLEDGVRLLEGSPAAGIADAFRRLDASSGSRATA